MYYIYIIVLYFNPSIIPKLLYYGYIFVLYMIFVLHSILVLYLIFVLYFMKLLSSDETLVIPCLYSHRLIYGWTPFLWWIPGGRRPTGNGGFGGAEPPQQGISIIICRGISDPQNTGFPNPQIWGNQIQLIKWTKYSCLYAI